MLLTSQLAVGLLLVSAAASPTHYNLVIPTYLRKGKEEYLHSAILADTTLTKRSDMDHTVLPANYTMSAFPS